MSRKRLGRLQRAATIVPLALLSAAWTASVAGIGGITPSVSASQGPDGSLPDGTSVPTEAIEAPASVSDPDDLSPTATPRTSSRPRRPTRSRPRRSLPTSAPRPSSTRPTSPATSPGSWSPRSAAWSPTTAAPAATSSTTSGVAKPGIYGVALNGRNRTTAISDTDAGQFDNDTQWDRAVGPMQFIPSTWSIVGVDADGDAKRNPQDVDDAALATAVYLCSGKDDLVVGRRPARRGLPLQPQPGVRRPGAGDHGRLPRRRLHHGPQQHQRRPATSCPRRRSTTPAPTTASRRRQRQRAGFDNNDTYVPVDDDDDTTTDPTDPGSTDPDPTDPGATDPGDGPKLPLNPGDNNVPDTNTPIDEPVEQLIDGLLGPLTKAQARVKCVAEALLHPLDAGYEQRCLDSYGL